MPGARAARRVLSAGAAVAAAAIPIAGCGHSASVGGDRTLRVALSEYQVVPQKVQVSSGELKIIVHNVGKLTHNLVVLQGTTHVGQTQPIWPGTASAMYVYLSPGTYTLASTLFSDQALGEYGTLKVNS